MIVLGLGHQIQRTRKRKVGLALAYFLPFAQLKNYPVPRMIPLQSGCLLNPSSSSSAQSEICFSRAFLPWSSFVSYESAPLFRERKERSFMNWLIVAFSMPPTFFFFLFQTKRERTKGSKMVAVELCTLAENDSKGWNIPPPFSLVQCTPVLHRHKNEKSRSVNDLLHFSQWTELTLAHAFLNFDGELSATYYPFLFIYNWVLRPPLLFSYQKRYSWG